MQRRSFIKRVGVGAGLLATPVAVATEAVRDSDALEKGMIFAKERMEELKQRVQVAEGKIDNLEKNQKKTLKTVCIATGLLIGLDITLLL